jgi:hypothetical protein
MCAEGETKENRRGIDHMLRSRATAAEQSAFVCVFLAPRVFRIEPADRHEERPLRRGQQGGPAWSCSARLKPLELWDCPAASKVPHSVESLRIEGDTGEKCSSSNANDEW